MSLSSYRASRALAGAALLLSIGAGRARAAADCDIRKVDWKNFRYGAETALVNGAFERSGGDDTLDGISIELEDVRYVDFDADGKPEAHVRLGTALFSDAPDSPRGVSVERSRKLWVYELDAKCNPRLLGTSLEFDAGDDRIVGNAYALGTQAWGIVADKFRELPRTHPLATELRVAALHKAATDQNTIVTAFVRQAQPAYKTVEGAAVCLERNGPDYAAAAKRANAAGAEWRKAQATAQNLLAVAQKKKADRNAWLRASEASVNAITAGWPMNEVDGSVRYALERAVGCHKGLDEALATLGSSLSQADASAKQLAKTVGALKAEKGTESQRAGWARVLEGNGKLLATWRKAAADVRARLTKAQRSGPPKQALAPKPAAKEAKLDPARPGGIWAEVEALQATRSAIQAGLEPTAGEGPKKVGDAIPRCNVRNVDWSNLEYTLGENTYAARAASAQLSAWAEDDKLLPSEEADALRAKKAKKKKKKKVEPTEEDEYTQPAHSYLFELEQVIYANFDGAPGDEAYISVQETYSHHGGEPGVTDLVLVMDSDPDCRLRLRGSASRSSGLNEGSTKIVGKRVVLIHDDGEAREWGFVKGAFVQVAGPSPGGQGE